jgi:hypothetical protein
MCHSVACLQHIYVCVVVLHVSSCRMLATYIYVCVIVLQYGPRYTNPLPTTHIFTLYHTRIHSLLHTLHAYILVLDTPRKSTLHVRFPNNPNNPNNPYNPHNPNKHNNPNDPNDPNNHNRTNGNREKAVACAHSMCGFRDRRKDLLDSF